ncbi:MAG: DinB family protein [Saprospiraceae bacterium]|nr:DinB family protein [Saprospiraceae bacterium]
MIGKPDTSNIHEMYTGYIGLVPDDDFIKTLHDNQMASKEYFRALSDEAWLHRYQEGKWTPKEILLHIIDAERIFCYRALRFARGDETPLAGFDQDAYVLTSNANARSSSSLLDEYDSVRSSSLDLFRSFDDGAYDLGGMASDRPFTVLALGYITAGHEIHHLNILKERYFPAS